MPNDGAAQNDPDDIVLPLSKSTLWGRMTNWHPYRILVEFITASPRRQFIILAAFPLIWLLTQHLGPMLQMARVSLLESYPVAPGIEEQPIPFMYTSFSMGLGIVYLTALYMLLPLYSALEKLPKSYTEVAADLGAGAWKRFYRVTLPLTIEGISSGCILVFLISTGFYATPVLLGGAINHSIC